MGVVSTKKHSERIAIYTTQVYPFQTRGAEVGIYYLSNELVREGFSVAIHMTERDLQAAPIERLQIPNGLTFVSYSGTRMRFLFNLSFLISSLRRFARAGERPSVLIVNIPTLLSLACAYTAKLLYGIPYITIIHGPSDLAPNPNLIRRLQCSLISASAGIVCVSSAMLTQLREECRLGRRSSYVIPNGYDPSEIAPISSTAAGDHKRAEIIFVGALTELKDPLTLLESFKAVSNILPSARLSIVGEGPLKTKLQQVVREEQLEGQITFYSPMPHRKLLSLMSQCKVLVMTSRSEGMPTVVIEALALSKPVVATSVGGLPDIIHDGRNGYLLPVGASQLIANRIIDLLTDEQLRGKLSASAQKSVAEFTWQKISSDYSRIISSLLSAHT